MRGRQAAGICAMGEGPRLYSEAPGGLWGVVGERGWGQAGPGCLERGMPRKLAVRKGRTGGCWERHVAHRPQLILVCTRFGAPSALCLSSLSDREL